MHRSLKTRRWPELLALVLLLALPAAADPPGEPWIVADIGKPPIKGTTDRDANGVWSLRGSGMMRWGYTQEFSNTRADQFHCVYQRVKGDASITARFLGGNFPTDWIANNGLMIRADDTPGAVNVYYLADPEFPLTAQARFTPGRQNRLLGFSGPDTGPRGLFLRLQRAGNEITGFYSRDGRLWFADFDPVALPTLPEEALFGLLVNSDRNTLTARWDQVQVQPAAVLVPGLKACARDGRVLLEWRSVADAVSYNVYRGPARATLEQLLRVNTDQVAGTSFTDASAGLTIGTPLTYAVAALFRGADGTPVEGPLVAVSATPVALPGEWIACDINPHPVSGVATYDAATDTFTLRGAGWGDGDATDSGYFLNQRIEGNTQITARLLTRPTGPGGQEAGVMIREGLHAGARQMRIGFSPFANPYSAGGRGALHMDQRSGPDVVRRFRRLLAASAVTLPIVLRLTRQEDTITADYSLDDGKTFQTGESYKFASPLPGSLFVGLYVNAGNGGRNAFGQVMFSGAGAITKP